MSIIKQILCIFGLCLFISLPIQASDDSWVLIAEEIIQHIEAAESSYQANDLKTAKRFIIKAYFGVFEDRKMEAAMRQELGSKYTYQVERLFGNLRKAMTKGSSNEVVEIVKSIRETMRKDAKKLDQAGIPLEVFRVNQ